MGSFSKAVGGSPPNMAIGAARLGHDVTWLSAVGNDEPGRLIQRTLRAENVGTRIRFADDAFTGFIAFDQPSHDITRVSYHRRGSAASTLTPDEVVSALTDLAPTLLHVTGITPELSDTARAATLAAVRAASATGTRVSLDVNYRARLWSRESAASALRELLPHVHTVFSSDDEVDLLTDATDPIADLLTTVETVVITAGSKGAWSHTKAGTIHRPALPVTVVDSIGAGDAFVSGYLSATLDNLTLDERLDRATTTGAFCVTAYGDWEALPTRADLTLLTHAQGPALR
jgi:2-dehydro-3-deoxygluconokinase